MCASAEALDETDVAALFLHRTIDINQQSIGPMTRSGEKQSKLSMTRSELLHHIERMEIQQDEMKQVIQSQSETIQSQAETIQKLKSSVNNTPKDMAPFPPKYRMILTDASKLNESEELAAYRIMFDVQQEKLRCTRLRLQELEINSESGHLFDNTVSNADDGSKKLYSMFLRMQARIACIRKQLQMRLGDDDTDDIDGEGINSLVLLKAIQELESLELIQTPATSIASRSYADAFPMPGNTTNDVTMH